MQSISSYTSKIILFTITIAIYFPPGFILLSLVFAASSFFVFSDVKNKLFKKHTADERRKEISNLLIFGDEDPEKLKNDLLSAFVDLDKIPDL